MAGYGQGSPTVHAIHDPGDVCCGRTVGVQERHQLQPGKPFRPYLGCATAERVRRECRLANVFSQKLARGVWIGRRILPLPNDITHALL